MAYWALRIGAVTAMAYCAWDLPILNYLGIFAAAAALEASRCLNKSA
jgi:hypothetical protein